MKNYDLKIIPDALWSDSETHKPTYYVADVPTILIKNEYLKQIYKNNPISYSWLVHEYGAHLFNINFKHLLINNDFSFPNNRYSKFSFAYQFEYLKRHGIRTLMELKDDKYLMKLHLHHPLINTYFLNSNFILNYPDR